MGVVPEAEHRKELAAAAAGADHDHGDLQEVGEEERRHRRQQARRTHERAAGERAVTLERDRDAEQRSDNEGEDPRTEQKREASEHRVDDELAECEVVHVREPASNVDDGGHAGDGGDARYAEDTRAWGVLRVLLHRDRRDRRERGPDQEHRGRYAREAQRDAPDHRSSSAPSARRPAT